MVETYKIIYNIDEIECRDFFPLNNTQTRGNSLQIYKRFSRTNIRKHHFSQRVVDSWNNLPEDIITARSVNSFKNKSNIYWKYLPMKFTPYYDGPEAGSNITIKTNQRGSSLWRSYNEGKPRWRLVDSYCLHCVYMGRSMRTPVIVTSHVICVCTRK